MHIPATLNYATAVCAVSCPVTLTTEHSQASRGLPVMTSSYSPSGTFAAYGPGDVARYIAERDQRPIVGRVQIVVNPETTDAEIAAIEAAGFPVHRVTAAEVAASAAAWVNVKLDYDRAERRGEISR